MQISPCLSTLRMDNSKVGMSIGKTSYCVSDKVTPELNSVKVEPHEFETFSNSDESSITDSYSKDFQDDMDNIDEQMKIKRDDEIELNYEDIKTEIVDEDNVTNDIKSDITEDVELWRGTDPYSMNNHDDIGKIDGQIKIERDDEIDIFYEDVKKKIVYGDVVANGICHDDMAPDFKLLQVANPYSMDYHDDMDIDKPIKIESEEIELVYVNIKREIDYEDNVAHDIRNDDMTSDIELLQVADPLSMDYHNDMDIIDEQMKIDRDNEIDLVYKDTKTEIVYKENDIRNGDMSQDVKLLHSDVLKVQGHRYTEASSLHGRMCSTFSIHNFKVNEDSHSGNRSFQCKVCSKSFNLLGYLLDHERSHTRDKPFQCKICLKFFAHARSLKIHERIHTGEKLFRCKMCSKSFTRDITLKHHERTHTGEKPFQCKLCSKSFTRGITLKNHERTHTEENLFQCTICSKSFAERHNLIHHERSHTGEKPFQCKICLKFFTLNSNLKVHERIHTGEKPFRCTVCSKSFAQNTHLKSHERSHTGEQPFQCKVCLKSFTRNDTLKVHERRHIS